MSRDVPDILSESAWVGFLQFAYSDERFRAEFEADSGLSLRPPTTPLDAMIDTATGYNDHIMREFIRWATEKHWGIEYAPEAYRLAHQRGET